VLYGFVAFHLFCVVLRIAPFPKPWISSQILGFMNVYGSFTGAANGYSFFAPGVASQMIVNIQWLDGNGNSHKETHDGRGPETELRLTAMALALAQSNSNELLGRAFAAKVLSANPKVTSVTVSVALYVIPTMAEFRRGLMPREQVLYRGVFVRRGDLPFLSTVDTPAP
jgi:hypothetical protein